MIVCGCSRQDEDDDDGDDDGDGDDDDDGDVEDCSTTPTESTPPASFYFVDELLVEQADFLAVLKLASSAHLIGLGDGDNN